MIALKENEHIDKKGCEFFFGCIGYFNHYAFFADKLWKKVEGFQDEDEAEVKCAFLSLWAYNSLGLTSYPAGSAWCCYYGSPETFFDYVKRWQPVFDAFNKWVESQR